MAARENPFPYLIKSVTDLPENYQQAIRHSLKPGEEIKSVLMIPPQLFLRRGGVPQQVLLSTSQGIIHIRGNALPTQSPVATSLPGKALLYVHQSLLLLYGRLELAGEVDGSLVRVVVEYNTVGQYLLDAALKQFLHFTYGWADTEKSYDPQSNSLLDILGEQSFKFMNGLRLYALQPGETLLGTVFQLAITQPFLRFFRRVIAPASLLALSDQTLILIEEDKTVAYGWLITLCPRNMIAKVESKPNHNWCEVFVHLQRNGVSEIRSLTIENETAQTWNALWAGKQ